MLYLVTKPSHVGADVDELAYSLRCLMVCNRQRGSLGFLTGIAPSCHVAVGGGVFLVDAKPPGLDILCGVDRPGTCKTESYMEKLAFARACLSNIRVIMVITRVPLVELLCQAAMGWIPALEYLLPGTCGPCGHVLSCQTINVAASWDPGAW
jgi:hypothetical protein